MRFISVTLAAFGSLAAFGISSPAYAADWRVCGTMVCEGNNGRCGLGRGEVDGAFVLQPLDADDSAIGGPEAAVERLKQFTGKNYGSAAPQLFLNTVCHARDTEEQAAAGYEEWTTKLDRIATNRRYLPVTMVFPGYAGGSPGIANKESGDEPTEQAEEALKGSERASDEAANGSEEQRPSDVSADAEREQQRREEAEARTKRLAEAAAERAEAKRIADQKVADDAAREKAEAVAAEKRRQEKLAELEKIKADMEKRGKASLNTDANTCVSGAQLEQNASFQGNTAASVVNGCGVPVDIRICLMTEGGWNCGVAWGVASQAGWSHSSFKATGPVFVDARVTGSSQPLRQPN